MDYLHNGLTKSEIYGNSNNLILKVNSRDRDITKEPNPFDFKIKFNRTSGKYTTYFEKGYFGSGNRWKKNDSSPQNTWNEGSFYYNKTFNISNGAIIEDSIEEIKDIAISEIVAPRFVPEEEIGLRLYNLEIMNNTIDSSGIFLRGVDNTSVSFISDIATYNGSNRQYNFVALNNVYGNKYYLFSEKDLSDLPEGLKKNYYLFNDYSTDTILLNDKLFKVSDIKNNCIKLACSDSTPANINDFLKISNIKLARYFNDTIWYQQKGSSATIDNISFSSNSIIFDQSAESLLTCDLVKNSCIEVVTRETSTSNRKFHYLKISSVTHDIELNYGLLGYESLRFNNNKIYIDKLPKGSVDALKNVSNVTRIEIQLSSNNNGSYNVKKINQLGDCGLEIILQSNVSANEEDSNARIEFFKVIRKTYPNINLSESEYEILKESFTDAQITNKTTIVGEWIYNSAPANNLYDYTFIHLKQGMKDLLNEKLFYVSLDPIVPSRSLTTTNKLNNVIGTFYPSTQSKNYIFLSGKNGQKFHHRNLQNLRELNFKLYYLNGKQVGETLKNYSLDYLELDNKQTNITMMVDQVDRTLN